MEISQIIMENIKIVICTTFRDFKGTENDKIQHLFLESLEKQSYKNFDLVVTLFGETRVKEEVSKYSINSFFYDHGRAEDYRYSLSYVLLNGIKHAEERYENYIILWTTCDVIYPPDFFYGIIQSYSYNIIGTSHPHRIYSSISEFERKFTTIKSTPNSGFDVLFFDKAFFSNKNILYSVKNFIFTDWGLYEHFLIALAELNKNSKKINLYPEFEIEKIENNRKLVGESIKFIHKSYKRNFYVFKQFLSKYNITDNYFDLTFCFIKMLSQDRKFNYFWEFKFQILAYYLKYPLRKIKRKIKDILLKINKDNLFVWY